MNRRKEFDDGLQPFVVVAIDKDKGSQSALKWALDNLVHKGETVILVHVNDNPSHGTNYPEERDKELFLPFRYFCMRKDVQSQATTLDGRDVAKVIIDFVAQNSVEKLVLGSTSKTSFIQRFKSGHNVNGVLKGAPDFCTVFVVSKGKLSSTKKAVRPVPTISPLVSQVQNKASVVAPEKINDTTPVKPPARYVVTKCDSQSIRLLEEKEANRSPSCRDVRRSSVKSSYADISMTGSDISYVSTGGMSTDRMLPSLFDDFRSSDVSFDTIRTPLRLMESDQIKGGGGLYSSFSNESGNSSSWSSLSQPTDEKEAELRRLKLELKQTMDMYSAACKEALSAQQRAGELHRWNIEEQQRLQQARLSEEAAIAMAERERAKCRVAMEAVEAARQSGAQNRKNSGGSLGHEIRYRRYHIDEIEAATDFFSPGKKIGEGGYGPVFKCYLDHTPVAVKVLRPDAAQGRSQFQQEVEILSCIRHPNMVLLLGACPEYGCLVYEYMANGSLEDRLFRRGNTPVLSWQIRFRIAAEIATGLLFLHQTKPEPLVHRDLKPANILLDRNYTSKISDVGLARLVPPSVADTVTQYRMTCTAGTFCYIDPEYQQTGMLGKKSDVYSLGIMLLQILTGRPPMGLTHYVGDALRNGVVDRLLDPAVPNWPVQEASALAKLSLRCAEMRRKDRPDLGSELLPELNKLRDLADQSSYVGFLGASADPSPIHSQEVISDIHTTQDVYESRSSASSYSGKRSMC